MSTFGELSKQNMLSAERLIEADNLNEGSFEIEEEGDVEELLNNLEMHNL